MKLSDQLGKINEKNDSGASRLEETEEELQIFDKKQEGYKKKHKDRLFICSLYLMFIVIALILLVRISHFILPDHWKWLVPSQLAEIDKFFFTGAIGGALGRYGNRIFT